MFRSVGTYLIKMRRLIKRGFDVVPLFENEKLSGVLASSGSKKPPTYLARFGYRPFAQKVNGEFPLSIASALI